MRRLVAIIAAALWGTALIACTGTEEGADPLPAPTAASDGGGATEDPTEEPTEKPTEEDPPAGTTIESLWVDDSWTIEDIGEDLCALGGLTEGASSQQEGFFLCGPIAAGAESCTLEEESTVVCIVDPLEHHAIRFDSPAAADPDTERWPAEMVPTPLFVELEGGVICAPISHDHDQHYDGQYSWFRCDDGSELLTEAEIDETFVRDDAWTAQRSVDLGAPKPVLVTTVTFAGR